MTIEICGKEPHQYTNEKFREFDNPAYANKYTLVTGDSFEMGGAYSLHRTKDEAKRYLAREWWQATSRAREVFVSKKSLEDIAKEKDKCIFWSWES